MLSGYKRILDPIFPAFRVPQLHFPSKHLAHSIVHVIHFLYPMKLSSVKTDKYTEITESPPPPKTKKNNPPKPISASVLGDKGLNQLRPGAAENVARDRTGNNATPRSLSPHEKKEQGLRRAHLQHRSTKDWALM